MFLKKFATGFYFYNSSFYFCDVIICLGRILPAVLVFGKRGMATYNG